MSAGERRLWNQIRQRAGRLAPELQREIEKGFRTVRDNLSTAEMARLIDGARSEAFITGLFDDASINRAFDPARARLIASVGDATGGFIRELPGGGKVGGAVVSGFNVLDPRIREAVGKLDTRVMSSLRGEIRETVREAYRQGITAGHAPNKIARTIRDTVGLAPNQLEVVVNFRKALEAGDYSKAFRYRLRDKRFDRTLAKLKASGAAPTTAQVNRMTAAYHARRLTQNARVHATTAANDSQRLGRHLATQAGIDNGILPAELMRSRWSSSGDGKERPTHAEANGEVVRFGDPFSTGDVIPGASEWGCRCIKVDFVARPTSATVPGPTEVPTPAK